MRERERAREGDTLLELDCLGDRGGMGEADDCLHNNQDMRAKFWLQGDALGVGQHILMKLQNQIIVLSFYYFYFYYISYILCILI